MISLPSLGTRRFTDADQVAFARLSGDVNPMHLDPLQARRTQAGAPVAHGINAALWALDTLCEAVQLPAPNRLKFRFDRFIYLNVPLEARIARQSADRVDLEILDEGGRVALVSLALGRMRPSIADGPDPADPTGDQPAEMTLERMEGASGRFGFLSPDADAAASFPSLATRIGAPAVNGIVNLSTLVGMHCPGLHSIFSKVDIELIEDADHSATLDWSVRRVQPLLRMVMIDVMAPGIAGGVECFVRHPPVRQPGQAELRGRIAPDGCAGARALVVGGSRGLGEVTARLLALAGAEVILTYASGAEDAEAVAADIRAAGGICRILRLDIAVEALPLEQIGPGLTHVYYFATPQIFRKSGSLLPRFMDIYVHGFHRLISGLDSSRGLHVFYPSSTAVEDPPKGMLEYATAKAAGERLCSELTRSLPSVEIVVERLPRLLTDQTATVLPVESAPVVETLLPILARMHR